MPARRHVNRAGSYFLSEVPRDGGAVKNFPRFFRLRDALGDTRRPLVGRLCPVWKSKERGKSLLPRPPLCGARLGPQCGRYPSWVPGLCHPGMPNRAGRPPAMHTEPSSGVPAMVCQRAAIAFESCDAAAGALLLLDGNVSKGRRAAKTRNLTQKAKIGYCPCCAMATRVAVPLNYPRGDFCKLKEQGVELWATGCLRALRKSAAPARRESRDLDWAATNSLMSTPDVLNP